MDAVDAVDAVEAVIALLAGLSAHERRMTAALLGYPEGPVGQYMTPEAVAPLPI